MSDDRAVREGERPADHAAAGELFSRLHDEYEYLEYVDTDIGHPPPAVGRLGRCR
ncbi:hypothetical protein J5Y04_06975 [Kitasatospora sp. RG8]|uniref:hypothetical protein n=1 Tax=Kitasatospora sp. RG8 TaxID=2820815 RepID=UPI001ADF0ED0|nr:hypothetical protein [Kitasatospora sp. RG8]MBP0449292.1 hypothetical protein [Kitasatospora sp. RG8]